MTLKERLIPAKASTMNGWDAFYDELVSRVEELERSAVPVYGACYNGKLHSFDAEQDSIHHTHGGLLINLRSLDKPVTRQELLEILNHWRLVDVFDVKEIAQLAERITQFGVENS